MDEQRDIEASMSPGSYVQFLLANATQEVTQLIKNYLSLGQFEAARASILQLIDLDKEAACKLVYEILQTPHRMCVSTSPQSQFSHFFAASATSILLF
jgi:hypothetical protein